MGNKYPDGQIVWKWLEERGFRLLADKHQYAYAQSLLADTDTVRGVFSDSPAGTGKTTIAALIGAYLVQKGEYDRIIYIRNTVAVRESGFIPGDVTAKEAPYMAPIADALEKVAPGTFEAWQVEDSYGNPPKLVCLTTSYTRGVNWEKSFIIVDETQNFDMHELQTVNTRPTDDSKIVMVGSTRQVDNTKLKRIAGLTPFEVFMIHYRGQNATYHKLQINYRGEWSRHADEVGETIKKLLAEGAPSDHSGYADPVPEVSGGDYTA